MTAVVPGHRCGAVPVSHRVPSLLPQPPAGPAAGEPVAGGPYWCAGGGRPGRPPGRRTVSTRRFLTVR